MNITRTIHNTKNWFGSDNSVLTLEILLREALKDIA
jgi:uncharacterized protein YjiS (DUF1127 family)